MWIWIQIRIPDLDLDLDPDPDLDLDLDLDFGPWILDPGFWTLKIELTLSEFPFSDQKNANGRRVANPTCRVVCVLSIGRPAGSGGTPPGRTETLSYRSQNPNRPGAMFREKSEFGASGALGWSGMLQNEPPMLPDPAQMQNEQFRKNAMLL